MLWAKPCVCACALEFTRGSCSRCGRWLASEIGREYDMADLPGYARLEVKVLDWRLKLRKEAEEAGATDTDDNYKAWLEAKLAETEAWTDRYVKKIRKEKNKEAVAA